MKIKFYYYLIISSFLLYSCSNDPVEAQISSGGHELQTYSNSSSTFSTIQMGNKIGNSSNLYVGEVNSKKSYALIKINSDVFSGNDNICSNGNIDSINLILNLPYENLYSLQQMNYNNADSILSNALDNDNTIPSINNELNAYLSIQSDFNEIWNENSSINLNEIDNYFIFDDDSLHIDSFKNNLLPLNIGASFIAVYLDSINLNDISILDFICSSDDESSIVIFLENSGDNFIEFESANSPFLQPYLHVIYKEKVSEYISYDKFEINDFYNYLNIDSVYIQDNADVDEFGTIISFGSILDTINILETFNLNQEVDLFDIIVTPDFHENDTLGLINFSLKNIMLAYRNYDPSGDNFDSVSNNSGTENNYIWDYGEKFDDCGLDGLCNEEEFGYNPNGTENNGLYDLGEIFLDYGTDALHDSLELLDSINDNFNVDPNNDDYNIELNLLGTENNNSCDIGESFLDYGVDGIPDSLEGNYYKHDNFNIDPNGDNYDEELNNSGTENNNFYDFGEVFLDYGLDGLQDSLEAVDSIDDNYNSISNPNGTEGNNVWDIGEWFIDTGIDGLLSINEPGYNNGTEGNNVWDTGEWFKDTGIDRVWSIDEPGYNMGTEGNGIYDLGEFFLDYGLDGLQDSLEVVDSIDDNFNIDPNNDDWNDCGIDQCCDPYEDGNDGCLEYINSDYLDGNDLNGDNFDFINNANGTENNSVYDNGEGWEANNIIDWLDTDTDSLYDFEETETGELWFDWGIDQIQNNSEPYYGSFPLSYTTGLNNYLINNNNNNIDSTFSQPDTSSIYDANIWISEIKKNIENNLVITISINTSKEIAALQLQLDHVRFYNNDTLWNSNSINVSYVNSLRLIEDISIYKQNIKELDDSIYINYSESYSAIIDFPDLNIFLEENPDVVISNALLTVYPDTLLSNDGDYFRLFLNRITDSYNGEEYIDSLSNEYILDYPYYYSYLMASDSIQFNIKRYIQKLVSNEYDYNGLLLSTDGLGNNFDYFHFKKYDTHPIKLEILYSK